MEQTCVSIALRRIYAANQSHCIRLEHGEQGCNGERA
jgi:hypothetical protein